LSLLTGLTLIHGSAGGFAARELSATHRTEDIQDGPRRTRLNLRELYSRFKSKRAPDAKAILFDPDGNLFRHDRRVERKMLGVAQHQLKRVLAGRKFDACLGLARSKMKV
jgi:hypothetical protein